MNRKQRKQALKKRKLDPRKDWVWAECKRCGRTGFNFYGGRDRTTVKNCAWCRR